MEGSVSSSASTVNINIHRHFQPQPQQPQPIIDVSDSPRSSALPSPPDSPSSGSVSSLPSVSSSFFFSSAAASPPHIHPSHHSDNVRELGETEGLIIPSLTLPSALRRPSAYGQAIGELRILVLGNHGYGSGSAFGSGRSSLTNLLLEDNDAVVEVGAWEETEYGRILYASTDWIEHKDAHGLEQYEPMKNIEIVELKLPNCDYDPGSIDEAKVIRTVLSMINSSFHSLEEVLHPDNGPSSVISSLLSSNSTPLFTAMIYCLSSAPTSIDREIINELGTHIPLILLPSLPSRHGHGHSNADINISLPRENLSAFKPPTAIALRSGLFNSPETLALLRGEATDRYLKWREVKQTLSSLMNYSHSHFSISRHPRYPHTQPQSRRSSRWNKQKWEAQYLTSLSYDVARCVRRHRLQLPLSLSSSSTSGSSFSTHNDGHQDESTPSEYELSPLDPLHLPSLILFSISLLNPLRIRLRHFFTEFLESISSSSSERDGNVKVALISGFCIGLGLGVLIKL